MQEPTQNINPEQTAKMVAQVIATADKLPSTVSAGDVVNLIQDGLMPVVQRMQFELSAALFYISAHEDRIDALEQEGGGALHPEDAAMLMQYLTESLEIFRRLQADAKIPNLKKLIEIGEECIKIVEDASEGEEEEEPERTKSS